jgi:[ribosomal protein S5]-alanine N-acetyltransferase
MKDSMEKPTGGEAIQPVLKTGRLTLVPATCAMLDAECAAPNLLAGFLDADIPSNWPPESLRDAYPWFRDHHMKDPYGDGWYSWYTVLTCTRECPVLAGSVGSVGRPDHTGLLEIGYSVLPQFQHQGIGGEMTALFISWAFTDASVARIIARTAPLNNLSVALLRKNRFKLCGQETEDGLAEYELIRSRYETTGI